MPVAFFISQFLFKDDAQRSGKGVNGENIPLSRYWLYFSMMMQLNVVLLLDLLAMQLSSVVIEEVTWV